MTSSPQAAPTLSVATGNKKHVITPDFFTDITYFYFIYLLMDLMILNIYVLCLVSDLSVYIFYPCLLE